MSLLLDTALRGPVFGSFFMCVAAAIAGVLVFLRKRTLVGETLSHAAYPGVVLSGFLCALLDPLWSPLLIVGAAFVCSFSGYALLRYLEEKGGVDPDSALCFTLAFTLGIGSLCASVLQAENPLWHRRVQSYLYGQAVTLTDTHIVVYAIMTAVLLLFIIMRFREIELATFDPVFAKTIGVSTRFVEGGIMILLTLSIVIGIRSVGVILMSGMLIAPAVVARQLTNSVRKMVFIAACVGGLSAAVGTLVSFSTVFLRESGAKVALPPGPVILLVATFLCFLALLFAPSRGLAVRLFRSMTFFLRCQKENAMKAVWKDAGDGIARRRNLLAQQALPKPFFLFLLWRLQRGGWLFQDGLGGVRLTRDGVRKAEHIVRLHRLWEVYLVNHVGMSAKKVHRSAEEIEHILTPELERELLAFVGGSTHDPHERPIPEPGGGL